MNFATDPEFAPPPEVILTQKRPPLPPQVFKPFAALLLTGLQTRFYATADEWYADRRLIEANNTPHHIYEYKGGRYECVGGWEPGNVHDDAY